MGVGAWHQPMLQALQAFVPHSLGALAGFCGAARNLLRLQFQLGRTKRSLDTGLRPEDGPADARFPVW